MKVVKFTSETEIPTTFIFEQLRYESEGGRASVLQSNVKRHLLKRVYFYFMAQRTALCCHI